MHLAYSNRFYAIFRMPSRCLVAGAELCRASQAFVLWAGPSLLVRPMCIAVGTWRQTPHSLAKQFLIVEIKWNSHNTLLFFSLFFLLSYFFFVIGSTFQGLLPSSLDLCRVFLRSPIATSVGSFLGQIGGAMPNNVYLDCIIYSSRSCVSCPLL